MSACLLELQRLSADPECPDSANELLLMCYAELGRYAARRDRWQAVFAYE